MQNIKGSFSSGGSALQASPINLIPPLTGYVGNTAYGGTVTVSQSSEYSSQYAAWVACSAGKEAGGDGSAVTGANPWTFTAQFSQLTYIHSVTLRGRVAGYQPTAGYIEGSVDGVNWDTIVAAITDANPNLGNKTYFCASQKPYYYVRFTATAGQSTTQGLGYFQIQGYGAELGYTSAPLVIQSGQATARLSLAGLSANVTVKTQKSLNNGVNWVDQALYASDISRSLIPVAHGEQWRIVLVNTVANAHVDYTFNMES